MRFGLQPSPLRGRWPRQRSDGGGEEDAAIAGYPMMAWNRESAHPPSGPAARNAPLLRFAQTDSEKLLWKMLRHEISLPSGTHFRRQMAIGPYVADFVCLGSRLVIEVDGPIHAEGSQIAYDSMRNSFLRELGFRVLRFNNEDVLLRRAEVVSSVNAALAATTPTPGPSPQGGGELS